jgi:serine dehydrogenase proteinase/SEC-C motif-containing protein
VTARSAPCPCGSGKKYKRCHGQEGAPRLTPSTPNKEGLVGIYQQYVAQGLMPQQNDGLRKQQLRRIETELDCRVIVYAARIGQLPPGLSPLLVYEDFLPFVDLLDDLKGQRIAVIIETPGGSGETARDIVEVLHERYAHVMFIIPGMAKSAGTIMALGGHQIFMGSGSSLGPIDAQLPHEGKVFSADELLKGLAKIRKETMDSGRLALEYIPFLQRLSPAEIEHAENALSFAKDAVTEWLAKYKFASWVTRSSTGEPVTEEMRLERAKQIADHLADQSKWRSHGRSLRIADLRELRIEIDDFGDSAVLGDAIARYYALLRVTLDYGIAYKIFETTESVVARVMPLPAQASAPGQFPGQPGGTGRLDPNQPIIIEGACARCSNPFVFQLDFTNGTELKPGARQFPDSAQVPCEQCKVPLDVGAIRANIERQVGRPALNPQPKRHP